jgi:hypothetical protein
MISPVPDDRQTTPDTIAANYSTQGSGGFEIRIQGRGSWHQSVVEALRSAAHAGQIRIVSTGKTGAVRKGNSNAVVILGELRGYLDGDDRWVPIY